MEYIILMQGRIGVHHRRLDTLFCPISSRSSVRGVLLRDPVVCISPSGLVSDSVRLGGLATVNVHVET